MEKLKRIISANKRGRGNAEKIKRVTFEVRCLARKEVSDTIIIKEKSCFTVAGIAYVLPQA
jgi:hypothetical protein